MFLTTAGFWGVFHERDIYVVPQGNLFDFFVDCLTVQRKDSSEQAEPFATLDFEADFESSLKFVCEC
jgi:hypothetical protein